MINKFPDMNGRREMEDQTTEMRSMHRVSDRAEHLNPDVLELDRQLIDAVRRRSLSLAREFARLELSPLMAQALALMCDASDVFSCSGLARGLRMNPAGATRLIEKMVQKGLIERVDVPGDRRRQELQLTCQGRLLGLQSK